ncbi:MAG: ABC transporter substrate-binding protein [Pirellulales bacterium]
MKTPERIVSLISSATEILYLLGLGDRVVGVSHECDYPRDVAAKPRLTRSLVESAASSRAIDDQVRTLAAAQSALYAIYVDRLAELAPDLIITQAQCDVCAVRYEDVMAAVRDTPALHGTPVLALNPSRLGDVLEDIARVGEATAAQAAADDAVAKLHSRVEQVRAKTRALPPERRPRVACLEWIDPPMLAANWTPEIVAIAGGEPGRVAVGQHSTCADWSQIVEFDPQVVVIMPCGFDLERTIVEARVLARVPGWSELSAVRDRRVFAVDGNAYFNRSGPRLVDSLEILAHLFHPDLFAPPVAEPARVWRRLVAGGEALVPEEA